MTHRPDEPIDPQVADVEDLDNTEVQSRLDKDPEEQRNREQAPRLEADEGS